MDLLYYEIIEDLEGVTIKDFNQFPMYRSRYNYQSFLYGSSGRWRNVDPVEVLLGKLSLIYKELLMSEN
jgi:hypothetical protein